MYLMLQLPNLPHESVSVGKSAEENPEIRVHGTKATYDFKPKSHVELCESLKLVDFARAVKISGSGFLLYTNWGARLERALIQFLLDLHITQHGYTEVSPPFMVNEACMYGVGQFPKSLDQAYAVREGLDDETLGKLYLVPDGRIARGKYSSGGNFAGKTTCRFFIALTVRVFGQRRVRQASARAA